MLFGLASVSLNILEYHVLVLNSIKQIYTRDNISFRNSIVAVLQYKWSRHIVFDCFQKLSY